jgi:Rps23 Pro-64 3,4-dihydroxylase Tpa1-like proline 4-hydroxylase
LRGGKVDPQVRRSRSLRGLAPMDGVLRRRVRARLPSLVADLRVSSFVPSRIELEMVVHGDGDHFSRHIDTAVGAGDDPPKGDRVISGVYYFHREPKGFEGGELRLHAFGVADAGFVDIEPRPNILVAFPSFAPHEVLPVRQPSPDFAGSRFAVNCWIYRERSTDAV